jgi:glucokinase
VNLQSEGQLADQVFVGLDIGGTKTAVLVVDQDHNILSRFKAPTVVDNPDNLIRGIVIAIEAALDQAGKTPGQILAIGAGVPGHAVPQTGVVNMAVNLNITSYPIGQKISEHFSVPVALENDVRAATLGAYQWLREQRDISYMAYISIGTGIASGVVLNGNLYRGRKGMAGEIGHVCFDPDGAICVCGMHGCLEALASGPAIARDFHKLAPSLASQAPTAKEVYQAAAAGQADAIAVIQQASKFLARAVYTLVNMYDVEVVIFGGGVSAAGSAFLDPILQSVAEMKDQSKLVHAMLNDVTVMALPPNHSAATRGAIMLAQRVASSE